MPRLTNRLHQAVTRAILLCVLAALGGCGSGSRTAPKQQLKLASRYQNLPAKAVPEFLKDTVLERCEWSNVEPFPVSGFGLVKGLHGTGDTFAGNAVREFMRKEMITHQFGSPQAGTEHLRPEDIFQNPNFAIVRVDGLIPPGARKHQRFDLYVSTLDGNNTSSLAHGVLYRTDLKIDGANIMAPGAKVDRWASGEGAVFVNPAYALRNPTDTEARASLRRGSVLHGGIVMNDRPLVLRLRQPQLSVSRFIEFRIDKAFQDPNVAAAKDEAMISLYVPAKYDGDWEHFKQVVSHLFLESRPEFTLAKAKQLADEAVKPDAPLEDISYCWEGLGPTALPLFAPLITHEKPEVAFAAARAAAFLGDSSAQTVLMNIARTNDHPFQVNAVETLAKLPGSPVINHMLRTLLDNPKTLVRVEAYRALANNGDSSIISRRITRPSGEDSFMLDVVLSQGPPLIYASQTGMPRIAVIGNQPRVDLPVLFTAMENKLSISSEDTRALLNVFYRGTELPKPVSFRSSPDVVELIARLGGEGATGEARLWFNYCDVVAVMQLMADQKQMSARVADKRMPVAFMLQDAPGIERIIEQAPAIPEQTLGAATDSRMNPVETK